MAGLVAFGCGSPAANLEISAPTSAIVGSPFTVTVTAMVDGRRDTIFNSPIHFISSDSTAVLPADYAFTAADAGSHTFINGVTLMTAGIQIITATDIIAPSITATANVTVTEATTDRQFNVSPPPP
jgi:adhesin/invasin